MRHSKSLQIFLIVLLCLITYGPSLQNGFIWDDDVYVHANPWLEKTEGLKAIWFTHKMPQYYPIVFTTFWIEHKLWGFNPFGYHVVNLIFHILNTLLLFWIVRKLYPRVAFAVALLFAIHPIQVETVAWVTECKNLLALLFFLLAMLAYLRFDRTRKPGHYLQTIGLFICALLSKSISVCFVSVPILYKWWRDAKVTRREVRLSIPFLGIGLLSAINTIYLELYRVGAKGNEWALTFLERFLLSGRILLFYIYKLCLPFKFTFFYPRWVIDITEWWQWLFPAASILLLVLLIYYRHKIGRGPLTLFLFYVISIFPALGFFNVYPMRFSFVADHFSYLSMPALLLLLCASIGLLLDKLKERFSLLRLPRSKIFIWSLFGMITIYLCGKSMALTQSYKDEVTLWKDTIRKNPKAWMPYNNLSMAYIRLGQIKKAEELIREAIRVNPGCYDNHFSLGIIYLFKEQYDEAIAKFKEVLQHTPNDADVHCNLGLAYKRKGMFDQAEAEYKEALRLDSGLAQAHANLGVIYAQKGKYREAIAELKEACRLNPDIPEPHNNLGLIYQNLGREEKAIEEFKRSIQLNPNFSQAYYNLGVSYLRIGLIEETEKQLEILERLGSNLAEKLKLSIETKR